MTAYELMIKANRYLIKNGTLSEEHKRSITARLLSAADTKETAKRHYRGVKCQGNLDREARRMYPAFYIPPYNNGKKLPTVLAQTPQTQLLSANSYELEILRLLCVMAPENKTVRYMTAQTLERLKTTCFGNKYDGIGECFDASLIVLRFLASAAPGEVKWIRERIANFHGHYHEKQRHKSVLLYYFLCLSELPPDIAGPELLRYKDELTGALSRSYAANSARNNEMHPLTICVIRNALARLPEYGYIINREPYICEKEKRVYFDLSPCDLVSSLFV